jgi:hypothetical protein
MPRKQIVLTVGEKYHVFNRGVDKRIVFHDVEDYLRFYESLHFFNRVEPVLSIRSAKTQDYTTVERLVGISAYVLINNHFHLLVEQLAADGIALFMKRVSVGYTCYYNEKYERSGALFQGTYKRVHIKTDEQLNYLHAYVNENHQVHGIQEPQHMYQSSSLQMRGRGTSKLLWQKSTGQYNQSSAQALAKQVYTERQHRKSELFE